MKKLQGGCHCGAVRFEVQITAKPELHNCNCSMCMRSGFVHLISPNKNFKLLTAKDQLSCYQFNSNIAKHYFCKHCGIKSFYIPRSNPDGYSVNARCLDSNEWQQWSIFDFDGQNWQENAAQLSHLSKS